MRTRFSRIPFACAGALWVLGLAAPAPGQTLRIGSDTAKSGESVELPLTLSTKSPVQGFTAILEWDADAGVGDEIETEPVVEMADTVVERVEKGFAVLGVVLDSDGKDNEIIPAGDNILLGTLILTCQGNGASNPVTFVDGKHASVEGGPLLENVVVIEGKSIGKGEGLQLVNGSFKCEEEPPPDGIELRIGSDTAKVGESLELPLTLSTKSPVQGLTAILEWDADAAVGNKFETEPVIEKADTVVERVEKSFAVLGVVMDTDGKDNEIIPAGEDILLGTLFLTCQGNGGSNPIRFVDGKHASVEGGPLLDNVVVVDGKSIGKGEGLTLVNGTFKCEDEEPPDGGVTIDVKPGTCPNNLNLRSGGTLKVAIVGSDEVDVDDIDVDTVRLEGVEAIDSSVEDVTGPARSGGCGDDDDDDDDDDGDDDDDDGDDDDDDDDDDENEERNLTKGRGKNDGGGDKKCECVRRCKDGIEDLVLEFRRRDLVEAILEDDEDVSSHDCVEVTLTGMFEDGTEFSGEDIVRILGKPRDENRGRQGRFDLARDDVTGDGVIDAKDMLLRVRALFNSPDEPIDPDAADANRDGAVDAHDVVTSMRRLLE